MRHVKTQQIGGQTVLTLPTRTDVDIKIDLTVSEREIYDKAEQEAQAFFKAIYERGDAAVAKSTFVLLGSLMPLRQLCAGGLTQGMKLEQGDLPANVQRFARAGQNNAQNNQDQGADVVLQRTERTPGDVECPICQDVHERPVETPCRHWFCYECIMTVKQTQSLANSGCPCCRAPFEIKDLAEPPPREQPCLALALLPGDEAQPPPNPVPPAAVVSKLKALVADLQKTREEDPTAKCLVFSQFTESISWLATELTNAGFGHRTITGSMSMKKRSKAIEAFQKDPPTTIFLLSIRAGAVGINLTAANVVYMMEPCLNPALEEQAIGRVHRMGQARPVTVKRLVVANSIEERIVKVVKAQCRTEKAAEAPASSGRHGNKYGAVVAGSLAADKQQLKTAEWTTLFGVGAT